MLIDHQQAQGRRARSGERLEYLFEARCDWMVRFSSGDRTAVDASDGVLSYLELDDEANRLARYLRLHHIGGGDRVVLLLDDPVERFVAMIAVAKVGAACVPLDVRLRTVQIEAIIADAGARLLLSTSTVLAGMPGIDGRTATTVVPLDLARRFIAEQSPKRLLDVERGAPGGPVAYIVYSIDDDGGPHGVAIEHSSVCNFVRVAAEVYGIGPYDRVFQGQSPGSDLAIEETWVPWVAGATVVAPPVGAHLREAALWRFLGERCVTVLRTDAATLAGLDERLLSLRLVLVSGALCPPELIARWQRPGRRLIGTYGPPEATVAATWTELRPGEPPSLGTPLPTYRVVVLDTNDPRRVLQHGGVGEIGIAGLGLACGHGDGDDLAREAFVPDVLDIPGNPSKRIFRTGDLGRVTSDGRLEYRGRIEGVGCPRGRRFEPVPSAVVPSDAASRAAGSAPDGAAPAAPVRVVETALAPNSLEVLMVEVLGGVLGRDRVPVDAHFFDDLGADSLTMAQFCARVRKHPELPSLAMQDIYQHPTLRRLTTGLALPTEAPVEAPSRDVTVARLTGILCAVLDREEVSAEADIFDDLGADSLTMARLCARVRKDPDLPALSMRDVYAHPTLAALATFLAPSQEGVRPDAAGLATRLGEVLVSVVEREVPAEANFFDDLGADSLMMAKFCARVRKDPLLPTPSMQDVYAHPTLVALAAALAPAGQLRDHVASSSSPDEPAVVLDRPEPLRRVGTSGYVLCGVLQVGFVLGWSYLMALVLYRGYEWFIASPSLLDLYVRAVVVGGAGFGFLCVFPIVVKWVLIGRWKPRSIRVWSLGYVRFWVVKTVVRLNPLVLFRGSPIYVLYLRALGARIGRDVVLLAQSVPVCTDLLSIGDRSVVRKDALLPCYRARDGAIETGSVTLGTDVFVGEATVLELGTRIDDGGQLGHTSALLSGQVVPAGERWHGSPARPAGVNYCTVPPAPCRRLRKVVYSVLLLVGTVGFAVPVGLGGLAFLLREIPQLASLLAPGPDAFRHWYFYAEILGLTLALMSGVLLVAFVAVLTVPRLLALAVRPDRVYPLYGIHYFLHRAVAATTNNAFFTRLLGDSSAIPHYLQLLGYELRPLVQTGNNFGLVIRHETPYLATIGTGTVVADDLSIVNADFSNTSFRLSRTVVGTHSFFGNRIAYPSQGRVGNNCLLGTKVMIPIDGPVRKNVGLLGSPCFEIPRTVARDTQLGLSDDKLRRALREKNRHNLLTMAFQLLVRWLYVTGIALLVPAVAVFEVTLGALEIVIAQVVIVVFTVLWFSLVDMVLRRQQLRAPNGCSIYEPVFWGHERFWKVPASSHLMLFNGTPLKGPVYRLNGVHVGARLYDDGGALVERSFVFIGDDCMFNERSIIQNHSQEDGAFKSDHTVLGSRVTLGTGAFVHYGITLGDDTVIEADSFVMKGEEVPAGETWGGNPARELPTRSIPGTT
ncbi:non-ribosomal peptide synthetase-like protein [Pseudonocardia sediminis]|uniref:Non-ribosomal peptide synthetase-like protein n=1 Tax=Pseudonocardia sediminis TaxID=1397368 RepID=A0A4Q7UUZ1_PSEST|nr:non-ribosomal peptide synthetase-like protein [Pseudonocardia sediminis]